MWLFNNSSRHMRNITELTNLTEYDVWGAIYYCVEKCGLGTNGRLLVIIGYIMDIIFSFCEN